MFRRIERFVSGGGISSTADLFIYALTSVLQLVDIISRRLKSIVLTK